MISDEQNFQVALILKPEKAVVGEVLNLYIQVSDFFPTLIAKEILGAAEITIPVTWEASGNKSVYTSGFILSKKEWTYLDKKTKPCSETGKIK